MRLHKDTGGNVRIVSITLDAISSCSLSVTSQPILWVLGGILALLGVAVTSESEAGIALIVVGAILVLMYFVSQSASLLVSSNGGERITLTMNQVSHREQLELLLNAVDYAKLVAANRVEPRADALSDVA